MKKQIHGAWISFFCTLIAIGLFCGFALADKNTREMGFEGKEPMAALRQESPLHYSASFLGHSFHISLEGLNRAAQMTQQYSAFLPVQIRLAWQCAGLFFRACAVPALPFF